MNSGAELRVDGDAERMISGLVPQPAVDSRKLTKQVNAARLLREVRGGGPQSRAELARVTGLSKATVNTLVARLESLGYLQALSGYAEQDGPGRRAQLYAFRPQLGHVLGIDVGADKLVAIIADLDGRVIASGRARTPETSLGDAAPVLAAIGELCQTVAAAASVRADQVLHAAVGTPGVISPDGVVTAVPQIPGFEGLGLRAAIGELLRCPVSVHGEVHLSLLAERWLGLLRHLSNAIFIQLGVGVGASFLIDGRIVHGANGAAGEIGSMPIGADDPQRGAFGRFEWAIGGRGIATRGVAAIHRGAGTGILRAAGGAIETVDAVAVFDACRNNDPDAVAIVEEAVDALATGVISLGFTLDPEAVILSGGLIRAEDQIFPRLRRALDAVEGAPRIIVSQLTDEAVALGAVRAGLNAVEEGWIANPIDI